MLDAHHVLNAKVIHDEAKLDWMPLVFPKSRSRVSFVVSLLFQLLVEEIIGQNARLGQPIATTANFKVDPLMSSFPASLYSKINSSGMSVILIRMYSGSSIGVSR